MTGFGRGAALGPAGQVLVEIRSHNHRFLDLSVRLPQELSALEDRLRRVLQSLFGRGRIDVCVSLEESPGRGRMVEVDAQLARCYHEKLAAVARSVGASEDGLFSLVVSLPGVVTVKEAPPDLERTWEALEASLRAAAAQVAAMREAEGKAIERDLIHRLARVAYLTGEVAARAPALIEEYRQRLARRVGELLRDGVVSEERLAAEVVLYADRSSLDEELVRLESHLGQFRELVAASVPVGRKAEFILQEMVREVNTVGSKTQDPDIGRWVVELKSELEGLREQVQNVE